VGKVLMELTTSLDGYVAGPDISPEAHLGRGGERLHDWMFTGRSADEIDRFETEHFSTIGALILGRRGADLGIGPWATSPPSTLPASSSPADRPTRSSRRAAPPTSSSQTGQRSPWPKAKDAAGSQDVLIIGGADIAREYLNAGLNDEIRLHVAPLVLGAGTALFEGVRTDLHLAPNEATNTPQVTHLTYAVERTDAAA
jgi:dihydrofolate reductase